MEAKEPNKDYMRHKLAQAGDSLAEAKGLLDDGAELGYVVNSLFYAFYYPVLALLHTRGVPAAMQSVTIALFDKEFVRTGIIEKRFSDALHRAFDLKPKCSPGSLKPVNRDDVRELLLEAETFLETARLKTGGAGPDAPPR